MQYKLVITEKPSVAKTCADVLGAKKRQNGYLEGNGYLVSWCVGHLVELVMPQDYDEKYRKWRKEDLPIIPEKWKYRVSPSTKKQFNTLKKLMDRKDVDEVLCATDAGREGELIFRLVYHQAGCRKPFRRIWLSSMEDTAIRKAFSNPQPGADYDNLFEAARCREQADWIVGINATRLFSCLYHDTLNVGRVMTPTLAMVTDREKEISSFVSEPFLVIRLTAEGVVFESGKFKDKESAMEKIRAMKNANFAIVQDVSVKRKKEKLPLLFDLTSLQRETNRKFGFSAQQTLDYAQSLYEKKLLTYPRTDSRYITSDMERSIPDLVRRTESKTGFAEEKQIQVKPIINDAKVTDHTALLPTMHAATADIDALPTGEQKVLQLVMTRLLAATSVPYEFEETKVALNCAGVILFTGGKRVLADGWKKYEPDTSAETILPVMKKGQKLKTDKISLKKEMTKPPARFTEGTLLHAMETAGKGEIPDDAERSGIGTSATRAGILEKLVRIGFLVRTGKGKAKTLAPTEKGSFLIGAVPEELKSVSMTADWEKKLLEIERGTLPPEIFLNEISTFTGNLVRHAKRGDSADE